MGNFLIDPLYDLKEFKDVCKCIETGELLVNITGPSNSQKAHIISAACKQLNKKCIFITSDELKARNFYDDFTFFLGDNALYYPAKEIILHDIKAQNFDAVYQRINVIDRINLNDFKIIITSIQSVSQKIISKHIFNESIIKINLSDEVDLLDISKKLINIGYERVDKVEGIGQFAIRGGIVDVFPVNSENAFRIELFGDQVDSIRVIDTVSQRSNEKADSIRVLPRWDNGKVNQRDGSLDSLDSLFHFIDSDTIIVIDEPNKIEQNSKILLEEHYENCKLFIEQNKISPKDLDIYFNFEQLLHNISGWNIILLNTILVDNQGIKNMLGISNVRDISISSKMMGSYQGHMKLLMEDILNWKKNGHRIIVLSGTKAKGERLVDEFNLNGIESTYSEDYSTHIKKGQIIVTHGSLYRGFEYTSIGYIIISELELFGKDKKLSKQATKITGKKIEVFTELDKNDYVVHKIHGIGRYIGIETLTIDNIKKDYIKIQYLGNGFLYVPTNQLDSLQKYIGSEGKTPKLNKLGGNEWANSKRRVKESLVKIAQELVKLYAKRQKITGYSFCKDTIWQKQFEEQFPYEETPDQLKCIKEIKDDMEDQKPMDRLLCGDVGYGKTEVAIRAIFKAVMDGKQVTYLVPTTILAEQQYNNFIERMRDFPITVDVISRFRTPSEQKQILKDTRNGIIDVLIGTHRLLQKDVQFKDLGLLVIDEEQRFGVSHKEKLKSIKENVDALTLTATPIPRTLHMSLVGIRDISTIEQPPKQRYPVQTYVMEYNEDVIREAIIKELARNGQVFYLFNSVKNIYRKAEEVRELIKNEDIKVGIVHGQMGEKALEDTMIKFINGKINVLVCTTIIESGLDMPNVNTIIVEDSDRMGLAQLYQIRGRVGRSNKLAYAYITYKKNKIISEVAEKRLQAIKEFTEFGSGFKIAMRDLEIRGAGNLIGHEQHGHLEAVGYDMYCQLLEESIRELKGDTNIIITNICINI